MVLLASGLFVRQSASAESPDPVQSTTPDGEDSGEVVRVTARRQVERAQDVPISLTAVSGSTLEANGIFNALKLNQLVPSLEILSFNPRNTSITIRGLGANVALANDGLEPGVGVYVDGVFYARPALALFDLPDIASVEELRGPQGTLYGKNAVAGAININTLAPSSDFEMHGSVSSGDFGDERLSGSVSGALDASGKLTARLSAIYTDHGGYYRNVLTNRRQETDHDYALRGQLVYQATPALSLRLAADYAYYNAERPVRVISGVIRTLQNGQTVPRDFYQRAAAAGYTPLPIDPYARLTDTNSPIASRMDQSGVAMEANWAKAGIRFTSITAYRSWDWHPSNDDDLTALTVLAQSQWENGEQELTQEFRIASPVDRNVEFSAGLNYFWERVKGTGRQLYGADAPIWILNSNSLMAQATLNGFGITANSLLHIHSYAGYGQATWHVAPRWDLTAGFRYTYEDKVGSYAQFVSRPPIDASLDQMQIQNAQATLAMNNTFAASSSNGLLGGLATLAYRFGPDVLTYATYSHGEKSAGINLSNIADSFPKVIAPESVDHYEIGIKSGLDDRRITLNLDAFWMNDTNYQTTLLDPNRFGIYIANIPAVRSRGVEADATAHLLEGWFAYLSAAYTDAAYISYPNAPAPFESYVVASDGRLDTAHPVDLSNRPLPAVSKWALSLGSEYSEPLGTFGMAGFVGYIGADESVRSGYFSQPSLSRYSFVPGYALTNLRIGLRTESGHWDLQVWARNLFDQKYLIYQVPLVFNTGALSAVVGDPRVVGITLSARY